MKLYRHRRTLLANGDAVSDCDLATADVVLGTPHAVPGRVNGSQTEEALGSACYEGGSNVTGKLVQSLYC